MYGRPPRREMRDPVETRGRLGSLAFRGVDRELAVSSDGRFLAGRGPNGKVLVFDAGTGEAVAETVEEDGHVSRFGFWPGTRDLILAVDQAKEIVRVDLEGKVAQRFRTGAVSCYYGLSRAEDGTYLAAVANFRLYLWNSDGRVLVDREVDEVGLASTAAVHGTRRLLVCGGEDGVVVFRIREQDLERVGFYAAEFPGGRRPSRWDAIVGVPGAFVRHETAFDRDGRRIFVLGHEGKVIVLDAETARPIRRLQADSRFVRCMAVVPRDDADLATGGEDGKVRLWNSREGRIVREYSHAGPVTSVAAHPQGDRLYSTGHDRTLRTWYPDREVQPAADAARAVAAMSLSADDRWLCTAEWGGRIRVWDVPERRTTAAWNAGDEVQRVRWLGAQRRILTLDRAHGVRLWSGEDFRDISVLACDGEVPVCMEPSTDGTRVAIAFADGRIVVMNPATGRIDPEWSTKAKVVADLHWHPTEPKIAVAADEEFVVWHIERKRATHRLPAVRGTARVVRFVPGSDILVGLAERDEYLYGSFQVFDPSTGRELLRIDEDEIAADVAVSPDGRSCALAEADGTVRIFDLKSRKFVRTLSGHLDRCTAVTWFRDGCTLASGSFDSTVVLWKRP